MATPALELRKTRGGVRPSHTTGDRASALARAGRRIGAEISPVSDYKTAAQRKTSLVSCPAIHGAQHLPRLLALAERLEMQTITRALLPIRNAQTSWSARRLSVTFTRSGDAV